MFDDHKNEDGAEQTDSIQQENVNQREPDISQPGPDNRVNSDNKGCPNAGGNPGNDVYPGNGSYPGNDVNPGNGSYPGNGGYPGNDVNPGNGGYPGNDVNPGNGGYPGNGGNSGNTGYQGYTGAPWQNANAGRPQGADSGQGMHNPYQNTGAGTQGSYSGYGNYQSCQGNYQYGSAQTNGGGAQNDYGKAPAGSGQKPETTPGRRKPVPVLLKRFLTAAALAVFFGVIAGVSFMAVNSAGDLLNPAQTSPVAAVPETNAQKQPAQSSVTEGTSSAVVTDVTDVVDNTMPSLVSITNQFTSVTSFFGQNIEQEEEAAGSGIIIGKNDTELLIVSNNHVVADATKIQVQFIDKEVVEGHIKGTSPSMDLAVIAVKLSEIKDSTDKEIIIATMGDSDTLRIGEPVIAIGNALGYGQSVTTGVVSALNRTLEVNENGTSNALIQTDAAINPGNSGGALLDIKGQVIGINSNKIGGSVVEGMGYAIPISSAKPIINELMNQETKEKVAADKRGYLGISCINVTSDMGAAYGMPEGIYVAQVYNQTGAADAGLVKGDIIVAFAGSTVKTQADLTNQLQYYSVGDTVQITVQRGNPTEGYTDHIITVTLCSQESMNVEQTP